MRILYLNPDFPDSRDLIDEDGIPFLSSGRTVHGMQAFLHPDDLSLSSALEPPAARPTALVQGASSVATRAPLVCAGTADGKMQAACAATAALLGGLQAMRETGMPAGDVGRGVGCRAGSSSLGAMLE